MQTADIKITINGKAPKEAADEIEGATARMKAACAEAGSLARVREQIIRKVETLTWQYGIGITHDDVRFDQDCKQLSVLERAARIVNACESARYLGVGAYRVDE